MNLATAILLAWCIDRHWDDDSAVLEAVIAQAERMFPDLSSQLVW